jgi:hypothetical protein
MGKHVAIAMGVALGVMGFGAFAFYAGRASVSAAPERLVEVPVPVLRETPASQPRPEPAQSQPADGELLEMTSRVQAVADRDPRLGRLEFQESEYLGSPGNWSFLVRTDTGTLLSCQVLAGQVGEFGKAARHHWFTKKPEAVALWHAQQFPALNAMDVASVTVKAPGEMEAVLRETTTGRRWRLVVENFNGHIVPLDR